MTSLNWKTDPSPRGVEMRKLHAERLREWQAIWDPSKYVLHAQMANGPLKGYLHGPGSWYSGSALPCPKLVSRTPILGASIMIEPLLAKNDPYEGLTPLEKLAQIKKDCHS